MKECSIIYKCIKAFLQHSRWDFTPQHFKIRNQKENRCPKAVSKCFLFSFCLFVCFVFQTLVSQDALTERSCINVGIVHGSPLKNLNRHIKAFEEARDHQIRLRFLTSVFNTFLVIKPLVLPQLNTSVDALWN